MRSISFSGLDGTGKSTQIELLKQSMEEKGVKLKYKHLFSSRQSQMGKLQEQKFGRVIVASIRGLRDNRFGALIKFSSRYFNVVLDSFLTVRRDNDEAIDCIIYDRYFYDILVAIARDYPRMRWLVMRTARWIPRPSIIVFLDAREETVISRKPEHTLEDARLHRQLYKELAQVLGINVINSERQIEVVHEDITRLCSKNAQE